MNLWELYAINFDLIHSPPNDHILFHTHRIMLSFHFLKFNKSNLGFLVFLGGGFYICLVFFMCTWKCATTWASVTYKRLHLYRKLFVCLLKMVNSQQLLIYSGILYLYAVVVSVLSFCYYYKYCYNLCGFICATSLLFMRMIFTGICNFLNYNNYQPGKVFLFVQ